MGDDKGKRVRASREWLDAVFARSVTVGAAHGAARYFETAHSGLEAAKAQNLRELRDEVRSRGLSAEEEMELWDLARQEHEATFDMLLPNYCRYSYVVLLYLIVEDRLRSLARAAALMRPDRPAPRPQRDVVRQYKNYFTDLGGSNVRWEAIEDLQKVRNCIVHASGRARDAKHEAHLRALARRGIGITISDKTDVGQADCLPLYLEDDMLVLGPEYCAMATQSVRAFFEQLCDAVPLPRLTIDGQEV